MSKRILIVCWAAVILFGVIEFKRIHDTDIFWQVRLGKMMLEQGHIPLSDRFTYTHHGEPAPPIGWLAQVAFALLYDMGGWQLARAAHNVAIVGALVLAGMTCRRDETSPLSVVLAMTGGFLVMLSNADLRPQGLGLFCFAAILYLAHSRLSITVKFVLAGPILVVWQNMHPSLVVGIVVLAALAVADFLDRKGGCGSPWTLVGLAVLAILAQFATPLGGRIIDVSRVNVLISRDLLQLAEWMPPWDPSVRDAVELYWVALAGCSVAIVWFWHRIAARDRALFIALTVLSLYASRFIVFWVVALVPLWAHLIELLIPPGMFAWARGKQIGPLARAGRSSRFSWVPQWSWCCILRGSDRSSIPRYRSPVCRRFASGYRQRHASTTTTSGRGHCSLTATADGRSRWTAACTSFATPRNGARSRMHGAGRVSLEELERNQHPDAFFLHKGPERALIESLTSCKRWQVCYSDPTCVAFVRAR